MVQPEANWSAFLEKLPVTIPGKKLPGTISGTVAPGVRSTVFESDPLKSAENRWKKGPAPSTETMQEGKRREWKPVFTLVGADFIENGLIFRSCEPAFGGKSFRRL
ncbi:MAG: hypothetical protein V4710_22800 [Verrucomicrobiota bacterium]